MATEEEWSRYTDKTYRERITGNAKHALVVRETPLEAKAILDMVLENIGYASDPYYEPLWRPVEMRVSEFYESLGERPPD